MRDFNDMPPFELPAGPPHQHRVSPALRDYDEIHLYGNPGEAYAPARQFHHERLLVTGREHGLEVRQFETASTWGGNVELIANAGPNAIIGVVGGDGTVSAMLRAAYELGLDNPFLILNGGNAINQGRMHHYPRHLYRPERILQTGTVASLHPLSIRVETPDGQERSAMAFAYWTAGLTADIAAAVNKPDYRARVAGMNKAERFREEVRLTLAASRANRQFAIREEASSEVRVRGELAYVLGRLMGKGFRFPSNLFDKECSVVEMADARYRSVGRTAVVLALRGSHQRRMLEGEEHDFRIYARDGGPVINQEDGEDHADPSGSRYRLRLADRHVSIITSRPRRQRKLQTV